MSRLDWPRGWERTPARQREKNPRFDASIATTTDALATEMERMDVDEWRGSIGNTHTKSNGLPLHNANPDDPGFVLRWSDDGEQFAVACDDYSRLRDNLRSVYLWVHETRMRAQRPVKTGDAEFAAARLPSGDDEDALVATAAPHEILEVAPDADEPVVKAAYRQQAKSAHPDQGGDPAEWQRLTDAKEAMLGGESA
ncbi:MULTISPECIES: J domain-containing protein [Halolamina]|uniref:DnaJ domain-containing protein n=1 Tax=Halolamina pelagica TaxID=699431 RepID=A0A1I5U9H2_9EURY|nr:MULTISPECIES: J domain-containing protein [Halolamina]NHX37190.1 J domain-containing protein [Halolamina sp. R1-12]SFP91910.1 DnaJ domain-containing protein [Halolamina pelagica]